MKRGGDTDNLKLESASRRTQGSRKGCHKVKHRDCHQSHQSHRHVDTNRRPLAPLLSTSDTVEAPMRDGAWWCCDPRFSWRSTPWASTHLSSSGLTPHGHYPVAANRPVHPESVLSIRTGGRNCTIMASMTVLAASHHPGAPHSSSDTTHAACRCFSLCLCLSVSLTDTHTNTQEEMRSSLEQKCLNVKEHLKRIESKLNSRLQ